MSRNITSDGRRVIGNDQARRWRKRAIEYELSLAQCNQHFLRASGWTMTCANPVSMWLWQKEIGGIVYAVVEPIAIRMECEIRGLA